MPPARLLLRYRRRICDKVFEDKILPWGNIFLPFIAPFSLDGIGGLDFAIRNSHLRILDKVSRDSMLVWTNIPFR